MIVDDSGAPVWERPLADLVTTDFRVQAYRGAPGADVVGGAHRRSATASAAT